MFLNLVNLQLLIHNHENVAQHDLMVHIIEQRETVRVLIVLILIHDLLQTLGHIIEF